jgi:hypothetical protein
MEESIERTMENGMSKRKCSFVHEYHGYCYGIITEENIPLVKLRSSETRSL